MTRKILIMGLPGAGKTTLAQALLRRINAVHFNADAVRQEISRDLGFSVADRVEHARRMGWLCDRVVEAGGYAVADFICPTPDARAAFEADGPAFVVWVDRIEAGRFEDTNRLFTPPARWDVRVTADGSAEYWAEQVALLLRPLFDPKRPTALFIGRYQPFHDGHRALIEEGLRRVGQACIAVRDTAGTDAKNPFSFEYVRARIELGLRRHEGASPCCRCPTSPMCSTDATWATRSSGSISTRICKRSRRRHSASCSGMAPGVEVRRPVMSRTDAACVRQGVRPGLVRTASR